MRHRRDRLGRVPRGAAPAAGRATPSACETPPRGARGRRLGARGRRRVRRASRPQRAEKAVGVHERPRAAPTRETWPLWEVFVRSNRGLSPRARRLAARARRRRWPCATPATSTPAATRASSIWVVPADAITDERPRRARARSSRAPQGKNYRHAMYYTEVRGGAAPVSDSDQTSRPSTTAAHGDVDGRRTHRALRRARGRPDAAATRRRRRVRAVAGRRRADPGPAAGRVDRPRARARRGRRPRQHRPRPARPRPVLLQLRRHCDGRSEDDLAYFRDEPEFRCAWLFEQPNGDFASTIARQLVGIRLPVRALPPRCAARPTPPSPAIAAKAVKEVDYHRDHAVQWMLRLARGTDESRRRMIRALDDIWPYVDELFRDDAAHRPPREGVAVRPRACATGFDRSSARCSPRPSSRSRRVRRRRAAAAAACTPSTSGYLLAEMQVLARAAPGSDMVTAAR